MDLRPAIPPRILVVDDEAGFRELCGDLLADSGYAVDAVDNGAAAMDLLAVHPFHLVLTDINMPVMDGLTFLKTAKVRFPQVEIILMTAFGGLQSALEALRHGAYDYITKPFTRDVLLATVGRCLEKQRLAMELHRVQEQLIEKEKLAALGSVSGWLAHRMRNPLNVILMCAQYLKARFADQDERREVVMAIEDKGKALERMTHDFIRFSRTYEPRFRPENLGALVEEVLAAADSGVRMSGVTVTRALDAELPPVPLDKELVSEVLGYLIDNAVEAMGGPGTLTVRARVEGEDAAIQVENTGAPIPTDIRPRLFEPFFTTKERGTGLGLAISRRVVESHGGTLVLLDLPETIFEIRLPLRREGRP
jgi:signal transduction histidine kinase